MININFPIRIRYIDNNEIKVVRFPEEIQNGRTFVIEQTNIQWGRRPVSSEFIGIETDE